MAETQNKKPDFITPELTVEELSIALYEANQKLNSLNKKLIEEEKERSEFYANISHDLRSPMAAINGSVEYLLSRKTFDEQEVRSVLSIIQSRGQFLQNMINDIFTLASLNSSDRFLQKEDISISYFLEDFFYEQAEDPKYEKRSLKLDVPIELECIVSIDPKLIQRVLDNLFTNALKYSKDNAKITLSAKETVSHKLRITVSDTGIGIAKEHLNKIFDRSFMVSPARTPGAEAGCGFGLAIARSIVEKHGGRIWCESIPGQGSDFIVELPVKGA